MRRRSATSLAACGARSEGLPPSSLELSRADGARPIGDGLAVAAERADGVPAPRRDDARGPARAESSRMTAPRTALTKEPTPPRDPPKKKIETAVQNRHEGFEVDAAGRADALRVPDSG